MSIVSYELRGDIGIVRVNNPPVNALSHALREGITNTVNAARDDASRALVIVCEGRTFIAGADISEFGQPPRAPLLPDMLLAIEASDKPVVAAIHGTALGGGLETALACHYRCALASAKVGLPEVKLGLLPGAGGTQRVPRLAGVAAALDMITSGAPLAAARAADLGLLDRVFDGGDLLQQALDYSRELIAAGAPARRVRDIGIDPASAPAELFSQYREKLARRARGQLAPQHIVSCIEAAVSQPMDDGLTTERQLFMECLQSPQSAAMRHLFFAEREAAKVKDIARDTPRREIASVGIIGGGTMGGGIAMNFANVGIPVQLLEISDEALQRGLGIITGNYAATVKKGKLSEEQAARRRQLISGTTDYADLAQVDLVIEAVFENIDIKKQVFAKLDTICKPGAILATNTSYQDVNAIAAATGRPQDVIGMHFFSPANVMRLLEVVRADKTAGDVIATVMQLAKAIHKVPVLSGVCYGFIGNRMLGHYGREAQLCLIEGATPEQIDTALQNWGMAMGPLAVGDLAGLDIGYKARQGLTEEQKGDPKTYAIADALVEMGRLGQKSGSGYYRYDAETRARIVDPAVMTVVEEQAQKYGIERRAFTDEEIVNRLIFALVNEGARILEEGIAQRAGDIDIVYVNGYGFPAYRGGPMHYADSLGLKTVYETICEFRDRFGEKNWTPAPLLQQLAEAGRRFSD